MKKYISLIIFIAGILFLTGCKKDDGILKNEILSIVDEVPAISTIKNSTGSQAIDLTNLASFQGKLDIVMYFPGATPPPKVDIVVRKNGSSSNVKVYKAGVTTIPSSFTVTAAEISTLFGAPIALGDNYDFSVNIYLKSGTVYEAFPAGGLGTASGPVNQPNYSYFARFSAICAYDPNIYKGNFVVVFDNFGDFSPGEVVVFTQINATSFSFIDPYVTNPLPIIVSINPLDNAATIVKQKIGNAFVWQLAYTNPNAAASGPTTNFVAPCAKTLDLNITYTVDQGSFGAYKIKFVKQ